MDPDPHAALVGTYVGEFEFNHSGGGHVLGICRGPGMISITSATGGEIEGTWDFGPNTFEAERPSFFEDCGESWDHDGIIEGLVSERRVTEMTLSFDSDVPGSGPMSFWDDEHRQWPNAWSASWQNDTLRISQTHYFGLNGHVELSFTGGVQPPRRSPSPAS